MLSRPARVFAAAIALLTLSALPAHAGKATFSPLDEDVLEQTTLVPASGSVTAYTAPPKGHVFLTRFCGNGCVHCEGNTLGKRVFEAPNGSCAVHPKGVELPPGETVRCTNRCERVGAAMFSGVLRP